MNSGNHSHIIGIGLHSSKCILKSSISNLIYFAQRLNSFRLLYQSVMKTY